MAWNITVPGNGYGFSTPVTIRTGTKGLAGYFKPGKKPIINFAGKFDRYVTQINGFMAGITTEVMPEGGMTITVDYDGGSTFYSVEYGD